MNELALGSVSMGTSRSLKLSDPEISLTIVGDGRVEPELADRFDSAAFVSSMDDPRISGLGADCLAIWKRQREAREPRDFNPVKGWDVASRNADEIKAALEGRMGESWRLVYSDSTWDSAAHARFEMRSGESVQKFKILESYNGLRHLSTTVPLLEGWTATQHISSDCGGLISEEALLQKPHK